MCKEGYEQFQTILLFNCELYCVLHFNACSFLHKVIKIQGYKNRHLFLKLWQLSSVGSADMEESRPR